MDSRAPDLNDGRSDGAVLRTFALLVGIVLVAGGLGVFVHGLITRNVAWAAVVTDGGMISGVVAFVAGALLLYWGIKRAGSKAVATEASLTRLVQKYEKEGKTAELEDAREKLIELLIERDEQDSAQLK